MASIKGSTAETEAEEGTAGGEGGAHTKMDVEEDEDNGTTPVATAMVVEIVVAAAATSDAPTSGGSGDAAGVLVLASAVLPPRSAALEAIDRALPKLASRLKLYPGLRLAVEQEAAKTEARHSWVRLALHASRIGAGGSLLQKTTRVGLA
jgi:hypothetical protein